MDIMGTVLFLGAICCLIFALQQGGQTVPWNSSKIIGLFVGFGIAILAFSFVQWRRGENALIPLRVLRQRSILIGSCYLFFVGMVTGVVGHVDSQFLSLQRLLMPTQVWILSSILFSGRSGRLSNHERRSNDSSNSSTDFCAGNCQCNCNTMGFLCEHQPV